MNPTSEDVGRVLALLTEGPLRLDQATRGIPSARLAVRSEVEP